MDNIDPKKYEFTVTFWIRREENPGWVKKDSIINFPPLMVEHGIMIFFSKIREKFKIYLLHPELGHRKMSEDVSQYLSDDMFIAVSNTPTETKLYLNGKPVQILERGKIIQDLEVGDYVMAEIQNDDFDNIDINENVSMLSAAKILTLSKKSARLEFFQLGNKLKIVELPIDRIYV
jgi:hypothetical protein